MGERFTLDVDSFQRLLAAAWVLQCERDRKNAENSRAAECAVLLGRKVNRIPANFPIPSRIFEAETSPNPWQVLNGDTALGLEVNATEVIPTPLQPLSSAIDEVQVLCTKPAASVPMQPEVSGSLALAPERHETESNMIPFLLAELERESVREKIERAIGGAGQRIADTVGEWRDHLRSELRVKLIIRRRTMNDLSRYAVPVFALLILGAMLIPQISSRVGWMRSVRAAVHLAGSAVGVGGAGPIFETSHLRVTDPAELAALGQMSQYEVRSMRRQAEFGDDRVALTLGLAYETGRGVPQNCEEATRWVKLAAQDGNAAAEYNLGLRYLGGDGVRADGGEARKWLEAASHHGYEKARVILQSSNL